MVRIKLKVNGLKNLENKVNKIIKELPKVTSEAVETVLKDIRTYAIKLERGHRSDSILCEIIDTSNNSVKGKVYADVNAFPFFMFEYFGTGQYAELDHIGKTKHFIETGYTEWYIPVNKVERKLNYPIVTINDIEFYVAHGAKANHFLSDAEFERRETNKENVKKKLEEMLKEVCK